MKKAQSISINTIVVAIIALLVLVVLVFVFSKQIGDWFETTNTCETVGGKCLSDCDSESEAEVPGATCDTGKCCREIIPKVTATT